MNAVELLGVARRYTFSHGAGHLSTFLSSLSLLGLVLAITLLITVLSVMNGFDKEMRERILALVPHVTIYAPSFPGDWQDNLDSLRQHPAVREASPFVEFDALLMHGSDIETARGVGLPVEGTGAANRLLAHLPPAQALLCG